MNPGADAAAPGRRREGLVALVFLAVALALFHDTVLGGRPLFYRDIAMQWHPQVEAFVRSVAAGSWPLWNPYVSFGQPLLANPNAQVLYPCTWLNLVLPAGTFYAWYVVFHLVLAGWGLYALARHLGLSRGGALAAGLLWVLSGPFLSLVSLWNHLAGAAWLPWCVLAGERALDRFAAGTVLAWATCMALLVLAGSPESLLMALAGNLALAALKVPLWRRDAKRARTAVAGAVLAAVLGAALAAGQWLPTLELARSARRADLPAEARAFWSVHPWSLAEIALPVFPHRLPLDPAWRERLYESREPFLGSLYVGLPALILVLTALPAGRGRPWTWALLGLAALSILFALGRHTPVYAALVSALPPLRALRFPSKAMVLTSFCLALVAGAGVDAWRMPDASRRRQVLLALGGLLAAAALGAGWLMDARADRWAATLLRNGAPSPAEAMAPVSRSLILCGALAATSAALALLSGRGRHRPLLAGTAVALALVDLAVAQRGLNPTAPSGTLSGTPPVLAAARPAPHQRLYVFDYARGQSARRLLGHAGFALAAPRERQAPWLGALALREYAHPALLGLWGLEGSYGVDMLKLLSHDVNTVNALVEMNESAPAATHRLLRIGAVGPVIAMHRPAFEELQPVAVLPSLFPEPILVFRVPDPLPRAYVVGRGRLAPPGQGWRALLDPVFDPAREVVLPEGPVLESDANGTVQVAEFRPDRVTLAAELDAPGYVVLVDAYDAGWKATLDGRETALLRANVAFRAVAAPAGRHLIRFVYRPASVGIGIGLSALAAIAALAWWTVASRRERGRLAVPREAA